MGSQGFSHINKENGEEIDLIPSYPIHSIFHDVSFPLRRHLGLLYAVDSLLSSLLKYYLAVSFIGSPFLSDHII